MISIDSLQEVFRSVFNRPELQIKRETSAVDIDGWDSLMHINLIVAIEEQFDVSFTTEEIGSFSCVGDVLDLLQTKVQGA